MIRVEKRPHEDADDHQGKRYIEQPAFSCRPPETLYPDSPETKSEQSNENYQHPDNRVHKVEPY